MSCLKEAGVLLRLIIFEGRKSLILLPSVLNGRVDLNPYAAGG